MARTQAAIPVNSTRTESANLSAAKRSTAELRGSVPFSPPMLQDWRQSGRKRIPERRSTRPFGARGPSRLRALADSGTAPLQHLQIVKGWINSEGETNEIVYEVACSEGARVDPETHRCPDTGSRVDLSNCSISGDGASQLRTLWHDPNFEHAERAFYYLRVLENPTCRWSTWDALRAGLPPRSDLPKTIQERAWSSPIHDRPVS